MRGEAPGEGVSWNKLLAASVGQQCRPARRAFGRGSSLSPTRSTRVRLRLILKKNQSMFDIITLRVRGALEAHLWCFGVTKHSRYHISRPISIV
jgi:hypothetical protein